MAEKKKRTHGGSAPVNPRKASGAAPSSGGARPAKQRTAGFLRTRSDTRSELRFLPRNGPAAAISVLAMSLGALAVGAGVYGKFLRDAAVGSHPWATWLLVGGAALFAAAALLGAMPASPARVGDAGVALEKGDLVDRLPWHVIDSVSVAGKALVVRGVGRSVAFPLAAHPDAAARIASEAQTRLPGKVGDLAGLQPGEGSGGEKMALEPLQLAGMRCAASDRIIALDKDGRVCGRCGQVFHKENVPATCLSCDAPLA